VRTIPVRDLRRYAAGGLALLAAAPALARPYVPPPDNQTSLRADSRAGTVGTDINAESLLHLPSKKLAGFGELMIRMQQRHRIRLSDYWLPLDRHGSAVLQNAINYKDSTYNAGDTVASSLKVRSFGLNYTYSFIKNPRLELGASLGLNVLGFDAQVSVPARLRTEFTDQSAPAPLGGLDGTLRISSRFYFEARGQYVKASISHIDASLKTVNTGLLYRWTPNFTLGLGYIGYSVDVNNRQNTDRGRYSLSSKGPQLYARVGF